MGQIALVDWRLKSFESEARAAFAHLVDQGFTASAEPPADAGRRPTKITVRFVGSEEVVESALVLGFGGEDSVHTTTLTTTGSSDFGPTVAHSGHEMRKALTQQAEAVRVSLSRQ